MKYKSNINFTDRDPNTKTESEMKSQYVPHDDAKRTQAEDLHAKKGNIQLGSDDNNYKSQYDDDYIRRDGAQRQPLSHNLQKTTFSLGNNDDRFVSQYDDDYKIRNQDAFPSRETKNL